MLKGMMMNRPLLVSDILDFAAEAHPSAGTMSKTVEGGRRRATYAETLKRVAQLAHALQALGASPGDRIATLAWNTDRHFELYYAISGIGGVCHTINPRLSKSNFSTFWRTRRIGSCSSTSRSPRSSPSCATGRRRGCAMS